MKTIILKILLSFLPILVMAQAFSLKAKQKEYKIEKIISITVNSSINPATYSYLASAYKKAKLTEDSAVLIKLNTPGGLVSTTKKILNLMGKSKAPSIVWITPEAASATSAGALIASGAHFLFMNSGTNIGAATPIDMNGANIGDDLRSKAINDLVALISSLSQTRGRNPELFAKMVEKAASYTSEEAKDKNIIDGIANSQDELYAQIRNKKFTLLGDLRTINLKTPQTETLGMDPGQKILNIFADPNMAYILFLLGAALLYFEFQAPGAFIPGAVGALFLVLSGISFQVLPLNLGALALLVLAFILFIAETYIISYGILSLAGICSLIFGSLFLFRTEDSYLSVSHNLILATVFGIAVFLLFLATFLYRDSRKKKTKEDLYSKIHKKALVTKTFGFEEQSKTYRYLIRVDGELWSASSHEEIKVGYTVKILKTQKNNMTFQIEKLK